MRRAVVVVLLSIFAARGLVHGPPADVRDDRVKQPTPSTMAAPPTSNTTTPTAEPTAPPQPTITVLELLHDYVAWTRVAICEEGGWVGASGSAFPDSLGIKAANWYRFGGGADVSPTAQILVADRMAATYGIRVPDQDGCAGSW
jgi:hypothetical protein